MSTTINTTAGFYVAAGDLDLVREFATLAVAETACAMFGFAGPRDRPDDVEANLGHLGRLRWLTTAREGMVPLPDGTHQFALTTETVSALRFVADFFIERGDDYAGEEGRWVDEYREDARLARRAMAAIARAALAHDLAGETDPDVRDQLAHELGALELERTGERGRDSDDG